MANPRPRLVPDVVVGGVDWGGMGSGRDPLAVEIAVRAYDRGEPKWFNVAELYEATILTPDLIHWLHEVHRKYRVNRFWCGHEQFWAVQLLAARGLPALANQVTGPGSLDFGMRTLYSLNATKRWANDPKRCPKLQEEFGRLRWATDRQGQATGKPRDEYDHGISCVRYYLTGEGETPEGAKVRTLPLELQATIYRGQDGRLYDNPMATQAQRQMRAMGEDSLAPRDWIDNVAGDDPASHLRKVWKMITGRELELPK